MNDNIIKQICLDLNIKENGVKAVLNLLADGNTIPFIARYRKEATGALDEEQIRKINEVYVYEVNLLQRKEDVIRLIEEKGLMTDDLRQKILACSKLVEVEDLYRPYKEKKKTKATDAINNGLEPLAKMIMSFPSEGSLEKMAQKFINDKVKTTQDALEGAGYIIAEYISDNAYFRKWIRSFLYKNGLIKCSLKKGAEDEKKTYEMYYDYEENLKEIKPHRVLAINRAEKEKVISVSIKVNEKEILQFLESKVIKNPNSFVCNLVTDAIKDSYKRLIFPSVEREVRSELSENAEEKAIENFANNLENLLLTPPMKGKMVLGLDPAFRTGCKLAVLNEVGKVLLIEKIYPHEPVKKYDEAKNKTIDIINKYNIDVIAIGNGTASRESEKFISDVIKSIDKKVSYVIVNEAGASVYSASKLAIEEFPDLHVEERSAVSIGRRLQDPLSELVKIEPESIGVGLYQHDVADKKLSESLDFVVSKAVNSVGVNINTASSSLLKYISGLTKKSIEKIIEYREKYGNFTSREQIKKKKVLSDKVFEQSIGFMRILEGDNIFDKTDIHPESYELAQKVLDILNIKKEDIGSESIISIVNNANKEKICSDLNCDIYTLEDILASLIKPHRDPRDEMDAPILKSDVLELDDLSVGMQLEGTVRNVVDFGAFIDIGLHNDGLVHISKITDKYIKHPSEVLSVGDIVKVYVLDINKEKEKVSLTLLNKDI